MENPWSQPSDPRRSPRSATGPSGRYTPRREGRKHTGKLPPRRDLEHVRRVRGPAARYPLGLIRGIRLTTPGRRRQVRSAHRAPRAGESAVEADRRRSSRSGSPALGATVEVAALEGGDEVGLSTPRPSWRGHGAGGGGVGVELPPPPNGSRACPGGVGVQSWPEHRGELDVERGVDVDRPGAQDAGPSRQFEFSM